MSEPWNQRAVRAALDHVEAARRAWCEREDSAIIEHISWAEQNLRGLLEDLEYERSSAKPTALGSEDTVDL